MIDSTWDHLALESIQARLDEQKWQERLPDIERVKAALSRLTVEELAELLPGAERDRYQPSRDRMMVDPLIHAMARNGYSKDQALNILEEECARLRWENARLLEMSATPGKFIGYSMRSARG